MEIKKNCGEYISPDVKVIELQMQEIIAASNDATYSISNYTSGYSGEEDF